jgi:iron complex transport system substrate-binding protein
MKTGADVIFAIGMDSKTADHIQHSSGIPVLVLNYGKLGVFSEDVYESLRLMGTILRKDARAEEVIAYIQSLKQDLGKRSQGFEKISAYVGGVAFRGVKDINSTETDYPPFRMLNIKNAAGDVKKSGQTEVDREKIIIWNPDFFFVDIQGLGFLEKNFAKNRSLYSVMSSVKNGRVFSVLPYNYYNTNLGNVFVNAYFIGKTIMPENFSDVDTAAKADEIYMNLLGGKAFEKIRDSYPVFRRIDLSGETVKYK